MISANKIRFIKSLEHKKYRKQHQVFVVEGEKMVIELLKSNFQITEIYALKSFRQVLRAHALSTPFSEISENELNKISLLKTPNQALAVARIPEMNELPEIPANELCLALDNIQDPGNLGTIIRTANWFGIRKLFCSSDTVDAYNPKVIQSTMGAIFNLSIYYGNLGEWLHQAGKQDIPVYGTLLDGENLYSKNLSTTGIILMGNESQGITETLRPLIGEKLFIPGFPPESRNIESLNVSVATAIICAEFRRQQTVSKRQL